METVFEMNGLRVVDLSKALDPATETRRCKLRRFNTGGPIPDFHTDMDITSHLGTHVECPYHHREDWPGVEGMPLSAFMGRALHLKIGDAPPYTYITPELLERHLAGWLKPGDIVILDSCYPLPPFTEKTNTPEDRRLLVNGDTASWLLERGVRAVGFGDGVSIENRNEDVCPFHDVLLAAGVPFIEVLKNLDELTSDTFFMSFVPLPIAGLDSCPVRAYAIEGMPGFTR